MKPLNQYRLTINNLCNIYHVDKLYAFGSVLTNKFDKTSDIDLVVRFHNIDLLKYSDNYYNLNFPSKICSKDLLTFWKNKL